MMLMSLFCIFLKEVLLKEDKNVMIGFHNISIFKVDERVMKVDIHTHVLPGIDDGARDWDTCLQMLVKSAECGVGTIIATPHYLPWRQGAKAEDIRQLCIEAEEKLQRKHGISMDIYPGNEIYYTLEVVERLKQGEILTLAGSRYVLVEFGTGSSYQSICRAVKEFRDAGYIPVIAHVERYSCLHQMPRIEDIKQMGALLQMNVEAFQNGWFDSESRWAKKCLSSRMIDFLASDMHSVTRRPPMSRQQLDWVRKKLDSDYRKALLYQNSRKIFD